MTSFRTVVAHAHSYSETTSSGYGIRGVTLRVWCNVIDRAWPEVGMAKAGRPVLAFREDGVAFTTADSSEERKVRHFRHSCLGLGVYMYLCGDVTIRETFRVLVGRWI